jgi:DNA-binding Lrp family transcriptional regulator
MATKTKLDRIDFEILAALQKNARLSNKELAARVDLAPSSCLERVRRIQEKGALKGFHAAVDPHIVGVEVQALIAVRIRRHSRRLIEDFHQHASSLQEVVAIYHVAGANDFLVHVAVRDTEQLRDLVLDSFTTRTEIEHMETSLIFGYEQKWTLPNYLAEE